MPNERFALILQMKVSGLLEAFMQETKLPLKQALHVVYHSKCYEALAEEGTKLWHQSPLFLLDTFLAEMKFGHLEWPDE